MSEFPALPLWTDAYLGDTTHLTTIEHGAYLLLLMAMWRSKDCRLPSDDKSLARYCRLTTGQWQRIRPTIMDFFHEGDGFITQGRLTDEYNLVRRRSLSASDSARARWRKNNDSADAVAMRSECEGNATTPTPSILPLDISLRSISVPKGTDHGDEAQSAGGNPKPASKPNSKNGKSEGPARGTRWAAGQEVPTEWVQEAVDTLPELENRLGRRVQECLDVRLEAVEFANYWSSVPGAKGIKLDWRATWRNRIIDQAKKTPLKARDHGRIFT